MKTKLPLGVPLIVDILIDQLTSIWHICSGTGIITHCFPYMVRCDLIFLGGKVMWSTRRGSCGSSKLTRSDTILIGFDLFPLAISHILFTKKKV